jgi:hypothetical protein
MRSFVEENTGRWVRSACPHASHSEPIAKQLESGGNYSGFYSGGTWFVSSSFLRDECQDRASKLAATASFQIISIHNAIIFPLNSYVLVWATDKGSWAISIKLRNSCTAQPVCATGRHVGFTAVCPSVVCKCCTLFVETVKFTF